MALPMDRDLDPAKGIAHVKCVGSMCKNSKYVKYLFFHTCSQGVCRKEGGGGRVKGRRWRKGGRGFSAQVKDKGKEGT